MGAVSLNDIIITPLAQIEADGGSVLHAMKSSSQGYYGYGEAYFSSINSNSIKAWKLHSRMTMNLVVPIGKVRFVFCLENKQEKQFRVEEIGEHRYSRITVPPGIWFGFLGLSNSKSLILNISNIEYDKSEVIKSNLNSIIYNWDL